MSVRTHHVAASLLAGVIVLSGLGWLAFDTPVAQANCGTGSSVIVTSPSSAGTNAPLSGVSNFTAYSTPTAASGMTFMLTAPNQAPMGEAVQNGSTWKLDWDTRNVANGSYQLIAVAHFGSATTLDCASPIASFVVQNVATQSPKLTAAITPGTWQMPAGTSSNFSVDAIYTDQYGRQSHVGPSANNPFMWSASIGKLSTLNGPTTVLSAGSAPGTGILHVNVNYAGLAAPAAAQIKITPATTASGPGDATKPAPSPSPTPSTVAPDSSATTDDTTRLATMPTIFRPADPTNTNPVVPLSTLSCLEKKVGLARFNEISSGKSEPTAAERKLAADCFSGPTPIPAVLAPVPPAKLTELEQTNDLVKVSSIKNTTVTNKDGKKITGLLLSGQGAPGSNVFIYVFSDPLVLRAQTDAKGSWSYVLETPLKPGKHELYAVAEKDAGTFVRSSAIPIQIAAAAPGSQDGSLVIERQISPAQIGFIALAAVMVLASIAVVFTILRKRRKPATPAAAPGLILPDGQATTPATATATTSPAGPAPDPTTPPEPLTPSPSANNNTAAANNTTTTAQTPAPMTPNETAPGSGNHDPQV